MFPREPSLRRQRRFVPALLFCLATLFAGSLARADNGTMAVSAVIPTRHVCWFLTNNMNLAFGTINPTQSSNITATANATFFCFGSGANATFLISAGDGTYPSGPGQRRMRHNTVAGQYLPYSISWTPTSATVPQLTAQTLTVTGTLQPIHFQNARTGSFQDTVVITITP